MSYYVAAVAACPVSIAYRVYTNMRGSDFEYFINEKWLFAPEEHPVCSKIRG